MISVSIYTRHTQGTYSESPRCLCVGSLGNAASTLAYYRSEPCNYTDAWATIVDQCDTCGGSGTVAKKRPAFARKPCPTCKGVEAPETYATLDELIALASNK